MRKTKLAFPKPFEGKPRINAAGIYGASPGKEILYKIPVTGQRPINFSAKLPDGIKIDENGIIRGKLAEGEYHATISAENELGAHTKEIIFKIKKDGVCLTPLMGWTSWNAFRDKISSEVILDAAKLLVDEGLSEYGYSYVNIDSNWQGEYGGEFFAIMPGDNFPDMKALCDKIHAMGFKCGIYGTPMVRSFGVGDTIPGCTRGESDEKWRKTYFGIGKEHYEENNVKQWTAWGFDYLKYDWCPCDTENADLMRKALSKSERDFAFCVTTTAVWEKRDYWKENCTSWRQNIDSDDVWETVCEVCFGCDRWLPHGGEGHFFDLDMLEVGYFMDKECRLTEDEQLLAFTARVIFPSPIQISCDLKKLTDFDRAMFCNEEVIAVNQDALCKGAVCVFEEKTVNSSYETERHIKIYEKELSDGEKAIAIFNLGNTEEAFEIIADGALRDLWAKEDISSDTISSHPHGVRLVKSGKSTQAKLL